MPCELVFQGIDDSLMNKNVIRFSDTPSCKNQEKHFKSSYELETICLDGKNSLIEVWEDATKDQYKEWNFAWFNIF